MQYLHTMVRIMDIDESLDFYCTKLGMQEVRRIENEAGRFTLIFLAATSDATMATTEMRPTLELTYNWPAEDGSEPEVYTGGRNFGHLAYRVEHIYDTCQQLMDAGITINRPPRDGRMAFIKSPDGISIELLQSSDALPPQEPWASMENTGNW
jgi:lactoylglutathione lyase